MIKKILKFLGFVIIELLLAALVLYMILGAALKKNIQYYPLTEEELQEIENGH